jgi:hypothetical protein
MFGYGSQSILRVGILAALLPALAGCYNHTSSTDHVAAVPHPTAFASPTEFTWTGDLFGYSATDEYLWDTVWDEVFIEFEAVDFFGELRVEIYDHFFTKIFDETYFGSGGHLQVNTMSELGFSGEWTIFITSFHVDGGVTLRFD